jgi:hypothetical protein
MDVATRDATAGPDLLDEVRRRREKKLLNK